MIPEISPSFPTPEFELPKDLAESLREKTVGNEVTVTADYVVVGKDENCIRILLKNMRLENKRRLNV